MAGNRSLSLLAMTMTSTSVAVRAVSMTSTASLTSIPFFAWPILWPSAVVERAGDDAGPAVAVPVAVLPVDVAGEGGLMVWVGAAAIHPGPGQGGRAVAIAPLNQTARVCDRVDETFVHGRSARGEAVARAAVQVLIVDEECELLGHVLLLGNKKPRQSLRTAGATRPVCTPLAGLCKLHGGSAYGRRLTALCSSAYISTTVARSGNGAETRRGMSRL